MNILEYSRYSTRETFHIKNREHTDKHTKVRIELLRNNEGTPGPYQKDTYFSTELNIPKKLLTSGNPFQINPDDLYLDTLTNIKGKITKAVE